MSWFVSLEPLIDRAHLIRNRLRALESAEIFLNELRRVYVRLY